MLPSSSRSKNKPNKKLSELATLFMLVSYLAYYSTLKMEAISSSEMSVDF
jgi:hypothetical protein